MRCLSFFVEPPHRPVGKWRGSWFVAGLLLMSVGLVACESGSNNYFSKGVPVRSTLPPEADPTSTAYKTSGTESQTTRRADEPGVPGSPGSPDDFPDGSPDGSPDGFLGAEPPPSGEALAALPPPVPGKGGYKIGTPYQIQGRTYYPAVDYAYEEEGIASWYGPNFHGKLTANGEVYDQEDLSAAHRTLPLPSFVEVTNLENGRKLVLRVNDRGPYAHERILDVSRKGAELLGFEQKGTALVRVRILENPSRVIAATLTDGQIDENLAPAQAPVATAAVAAAPPGGLAARQASAGRPTVGIVPFYEPSLRTNAGAAPVVGTPGGTPEPVLSAPAPLDSKETDASASLHDGHGGPTSHEAASERPESPESPESPRQPGQTVHGSFNLLANVRRVLDDDDHEQAEDLLGEEQEPSGGGGTSPDPLSPGYFVQIGAFEDSDNFLRAQLSLRALKMGYRIDQIRHHESGVVLQRIRVGPFEEQALEDVLTKLVSFGYTESRIVYLSEAGTEATTETETTGATEATEAVSASR